MKKPSFIRFVFLAVFFLVLFFTWSCDNGSSNGPTPTPQTTTPATMDQTTAETAAVMTMSTGDIIDLSDAFVDEIRTAGPDAQPAKSLASWALTRLREEVLHRRVTNEQDEWRSGSRTESGSCDAGTYSVSITWDGPDQPTDSCDISNVRATLTFSNCQEDGQSINGSLDLTLAGNLCTPSSTSYNFSNFSYSDAEIQINSTAMQMSVTEMQYTGEALTHLKIAINGDISMNSNDMSSDMEFSRYVIEISTNGSDQTITASGSLTGGCMNGWVTITTLDPILTNDSSECPVGGSLQLSGTSDIVVSFYSDGSMTVGEQSYDSCQDENLPDECQSNTQ